MSHSGAIAETTYDAFCIRVEINHAYVSVTVMYTVRHNYRTPIPGFKRHNSVNIRFIYMKISGNIAKGMLSQQI